MLNSKPNNPGKYNQGNYIPKNKEKVIKLNNQGGIFYRSSWEKKIMTWLDHKVEIIKWGAECLKIPYQMTHFENGDMRVKEHSYYPDFYYEMRNSDGVLKQVVVEVKPQKEYEMVLKLTEGKLSVPNDGLKKLKSFEYDLKTAQRNRQKWETMVKWCDKKGYDFIIITENHLKKFGIK
jgi:hypothetical protein